MVRVGARRGEQEIGRAGAIGPAASTLAFLISVVFVVAVAGIPGGPLSPELPASAAPRLPFRWLAEALGLDGLSPNLQAVLSAAAFGLGTVAFLWVLFHAWQGRIALRRLFVVGILLQGLFAALPPLASYDVTLYAMHGRIAGVHRANPYVAIPSDFPADPLLPFVDDPWHDLPTFYGPAFIWFAGFLAKWFQSPAALITAFKVVMALSQVGLMFLVLRVVRRLAPDRAAFAVALVAWNPLMLFIVVGGGHNDILVALAIFGAFALLAGRASDEQQRSGRELFATVLLGLGALTKWPAVVPLAIHLAALVARRPGGHRLRPFALHSLTLLAVVVVVAGPFVQAENPTLSLAGPLRYQSLMAPSVFVADAVAFLLDAIGVEAQAGSIDLAVTTAFTIVFAWLAATIVKRVLTAGRALPPTIGGDLWAVALILLVLSSMLVWPWYLAWAMPLVWLLPIVPRLCALAAGAISSLPVAIVGEQAFPDAYRVQFTLGLKVAAPALLVVLLVLARYVERRAGNSLTVAPGR